MELHRWDDVPREQMNADIARQVIHTGRMTIARLFLNKGAVVPRHHHMNEQVTLLQRGRLRFVFDGREEILEAGEVMRIAPDLPHEVHALDDSMAVDLFSPVREDWIRGDDAYLRR